MSGTDYKNVSTVICRAVMMFFAKFEWTKLAFQSYLKSIRYMHKLHIYLLDTVSNTQPNAAKSIKQHTHHTIISFMCKD